MTRARLRAFFAVFGVLAYGGAAVAFLTHRWAAVVVLPALAALSLYAAARTIDPNGADQ